MTLDLPGLRPPLISAAVEERLVEYLKFRHLYRNLYGFKLRWSRVRELCERMVALCRAVRADLDTFPGVLDRIAGEAT